MSGSSPSVTLASGPETVVNVTLTQPGLWAPRWSRPVANVRVTNAYTYGAPTHRCADPGPASFASFGKGRSGGGPGRLRGGATSPARTHSAMNDNAPALR